jgi:ligand-binding sensor protein
MHIFDAKRKEEWVEILKKFSEETGMASAVFDTQNNLLMKYGKRNDFCLHIKSYTASQTAICSIAQSNIAFMAKNKKKPILDYCDANCVKAVIPCFVREEYVGGITSCGCKTIDEPLNVEYISELTKVSIPELQHFEVKIAHLDQLQKVMEKYYSLINYGYFVINNYSRQTEFLERVKR